MNFAAASGYVVSVYVKDEVAACPAFFVHFKVWVFVVSTGVVNV